MRNRFNIKIKLCFCFLIASVLFAETLSAQSGIFAGGPVYYDREFALNELKSSGFTHLKVWTIHIGPTGDLNFNQEFLIIENGEYVGDKKYPFFLEDMKKLKEEPTSIERIEIGLSAWASPTYNNIKALYESEGVGPGSTLYENFAKLKEVLPMVDAINNDDEGTYDIESTVAFSRMLADLGFKTTASPYALMNSHWKPVVDSINKTHPGAVDILYLQCYAGGAGNDPCTWQAAFPGVSVYPGLWDLEGATAAGSTGYDPDGFETRMTDWKNECSIEGGFMWLYDDIKGIDRVKDYAEAINTSFSIVPDIADLPYPPNGPNPPHDTTKVQVDILVSWDPEPLADSYNVYFGTTSPPEFIGNQMLNVYNPGGMEGGVTYYWRADAIAGDDTVAGYEYSFTTILLPTSATNPNPADAAVDVSLEPLLSFDAGENVSLYNIYLDKTDPPQSLVAFTAETSYQISNLDPNTPYYWQVEAKNDDGSILSDVWMFTTGTATSITDSELNQFAVYPNPSYGSITISSHVIIEHIEVINSIGQKILELSPELHDYAVSNLPQGVYTIRINRQHVSTLLVVTE